MVYIHTRIILRVKKPDKILRVNYSRRFFKVKIRKNNFLENFFNIFLLVKMTQKKKNPRRKTVILLILISLCFIFNNFQYLVRIINFKLNDSSLSIVRTLLVIISQILSFSNSSLNFFLYALYSKHFCKCAKEKFPFSAKIITIFKVFLAFYLLLFFLCVLLCFIIAPFLSFCV
jgi:hypothetical protein